MAGVSVVATSLSAIKHAKVRVVRDGAGWSNRSSSGILQLFS
jgi:pyruvate-formate lyase